MAQPLTKRSRKRSKNSRLRKCNALMKQLAQKLERAQNLPPNSLCKSSENKPRLLTPEQTSELVGLSAKTLANLRSTGLANLPFQKHGSRIFYRRTDIFKYRKSRKFLSTSEYPQAQEGQDNG